MGYGKYQIEDGPLKGRFGGYGVDDVCHREDCPERIDRGLAYLCGEDPHGGGESGCGLFFCENHLYSVAGEAHNLCGGCLQALEVPCANPACREGVYPDDDARCGMTASGRVEDGCGKHFCSGCLMSGNTPGSHAWRCEECEAKKDERVRS